MENMRKGSWDAQEDALLTNCIQKYGEGKWHLVSTRAGLNRCRKSCRLRWLNYLKPNIKRGDFEMDEVDLLIRLHKLLGNRWSLIAGRLPGRTGNDVKNYWNTHGKKLAELRRPHSQGRVVLKRRKLTTISTSNSSPCLLSQDNVNTTTPPPLHHQNIDQFSADTNNNTSNVTHIIGNVISNNNNNNNNNNNSSNNNGNMNINACTTLLPETPPEDDGNMQWWTKLLGDSTGNSDGEAPLAFVGLDNPDPVKDFWTSSTSSDLEEAVDNLEKNDVSYIWDLLHSDNDMF